jgi:hypothetical protein
MDRYTTLAAEDMHAAGRRAGVVDLCFHPQAAFARNYVLKRGMLDGVPGLIISVMNAHYVFLKFAKLWALNHRAPDPPAGPRPPASQTPPARRG